MTKNKIQKIAENLTSARKGKKMDDIIVEVSDSVGDVFDKHENFTNYYLIAEVDGKILNVVSDKLDEKFLIECAVGITKTALYHNRPDHPAKQNLKKENEKE